MESTQRLDYSLTQELREEPELQQIGFLGICGKTYPINMGPNSIGRDPEKCNIVLDSASISRQHAVIHVLSKNSFMLMDLGSANGTKMSGRNLPQYISHPLKNGTVVQFGDLLGYFRLIEEKEDLPMTQQITDIPDTPVAERHVSRVNLMTTVPESPDVSDKDDSFIVPSQPKGLELPSSKMSNFIKPGRTISIKPVGSSKIDNIYWNSSKKSTSLNFDDSNASINISIPPVKTEAKENKVDNNIHDLETQMFEAADKGSIHSANTQLNFNNLAAIHTVDTQIPSNSKDDPSSIHSLSTQLPCGISPSIHSVNTQLPCGSSPSIYNANTQLPGSVESPPIQNFCAQVSGDSLTEVHKINEQHDLQIDLCPNNNICNAEPQLYLAGKENVPLNSRNNNNLPAIIKSNSLDTSDDEVLFDKVDDLFEDQFESQTILTEDIDLPINTVVEPESEPLSQIIKPKSAKRNMRIASDEIELQPLSQIVTPKSVKRNMRIKSDDDATDGTTDCEDDDILLLTQDVTKEVCDDNTTDHIIELNTKSDVQAAENVKFEDMPTQVLEVDIIKKNTTFDKDDLNLNFEDMPTQVLLDVDVIEKDAIIEKENLNVDIEFADMPTQVLDIDDQLIRNPKFIEKLTTKEENSPFKIPLNSALKCKKKEGSRTPKIKPIPFITKTFLKEEKDKYYQDTQDIYDDLCSQKNELGPIKSDINDDDKGKSSNKITLDTSIVSIDDEEEVGGFEKKMPNQEIDGVKVNGVENQIEPVKKVPSDGSNASDVETTPKKQNPLKIMNIDLPNSQEISLSLTARANLTESSSDSETENNSEEQCTPIVFRKKTKSKSVAKLDLTKKFNVEALPSRVITRVRKPPAKLQNEISKKSNEILKPKFIPEPENEIDKDIITENISRLKSKNDKVKNAKANHSKNYRPKVEINLNAADSSKRVRACRKRAEESALKTEINHDKIRESIDVSKTNGKRKREPRSIKKENSDTKNQSTSCDKSTNSPVVEIISLESKDHTHENQNKIDNSSTETKRSTRPRNAKTKNIKKSPEKDSQQDKSKRKRTEKAPKSKSQKEETKEPSPEKEIRRSKRQKQIKEEVTKEHPKSVLRRSETQLSEQSAVYNMSSTNSDSCGKRPPLDDSDAPVAKRPRGCIKLKAPPTPSVNTQYVLFTAFPFESVKYTLKNMGAVVVTDVLQSTVLLTKQIRRTFKLLCAIGLGKPIVGLDWVDACMDNNVIVDPWQHLIKDEAAENRFHFSLEQTLKGKRNFLKGYNVSSTPKVMPNASEMKLIVECSGGAWREGGENWICVSVTADRELWPELRGRGAVLVSTEFILGGVLRQRLEVDANMLK